MDMPIHMIFVLMEESRKRGKEEEKERIKRVVQKYVTAPTLLSQIIQDIDREVEVQENG
jgi:hypothetical protein